MRAGCRPLHVDKRRLVLVASLLGWGAPGSRSEGRGQARRADAVSPVHGHGTDMRNPGCWADPGSERHHRSEQRDGSEGISDLEDPQDEAGELWDRRGGSRYCRGPSLSAPGGKPLPSARVDCGAACRTGCRAQPGVPVIRKLERYCGLPANVLTVTGGDRFPPMPLHVARPVSGAPVSGAVRRPAPRRP